MKKKGVVIGYGLKVFAMAALLAGSLAGEAAAVVVGDKQWLQLTETTGFSYLDIANNACNHSSGECSGSLKQIDFNGWTWASNADVQTLFNTLIPRSPAALEGPYSTYAEYADISDFVAALTGDMFTPTFVDSDYTGTALYVRGITRDSFYDYWSGERVWAPSLLAFTSSPIADRPDRPDLTVQGIASLGQSQRLFTSDSTVGVWLYRPVVAVPEPGTIALIGFGLTGLCVGRRRKAQLSDKSGRDLACGVATTWRICVAGELIR